MDHSDIPVDVLMNFGKGWSHTARPLIAQPRQALVERKVLIWKRYGPCVN